MGATELGPQEMFSGGAAEARERQEFAQQKKRIGARAHQVRAGSEADAPVSDRPAEGSRTIRTGRAFLRWIGTLFDARQAAHALENAVAGRVGALATRIFLQHGADLIERCQGQVNQLRTDFEPPVADQVEGGFEIMRERRHALETKHGARALDGVQAAKNSAHQFGVAPTLVQFEQR